MATTYTNYAQNILSQIKTLIQTEFPELKQRNRYSERSYPKSSDFLPEYSVRLKLLTDIVLEQYAGGRFDDWTLQIFFTRKQTVDTDYSELTTIAERMSAMLSANIESSGKWLYQINSIDYDPNNLPLPENFEGGRIDGFIMTLNIQYGKF